MNKLTFFDFSNVFKYFGLVIYSLEGKSLYFLISKELHLFFHLDHLTENMEKLTLLGFWLFLTYLSYRFAF